MKVRFSLTKAPIKSFEKKKEMKVEYKMLAKSLTANGGNLV